MAFKPTSDHVRDSDLGEAKVLARPNDNPISDQLRLSVETAPVRYALGDSVPALGQGFLLPAGWHDVLSIHPDTAFRILGVGVGATIQYQWGVNQ